MQKILSYNYIYLIPLLFSALASLRSFRLAWPRPLKAFAILLVITVIVEAFAISWKWGFSRTAFWSFPPSNLWVYNGFLHIRLVFIVYFYYSVLHPNSLRRAIIALSVLILTFGIANYFFIQGVSHVNNWTIIVYHLLFIFLSIAYFQQTLRETRVIRLKKEPLVWISLGIFIYYSGSLPFFIILNQLSKDDLPLMLSLLNINNALNTIMYSLFVISFLCKHLSPRPAS